MGLGWVGWMGRFYIVMGGGEVGGGCVCGVWVCECVCEGEEASPVRVGKRKKEKKMLIFRGRGEKSG